MDNQHLALAAWRPVILHGMGSLLLDVLPVAVAIALEPVCVIAALILPATRRPVANAAAYLGVLSGVMFGYGAGVALLFRRTTIVSGSRGDVLVGLVWLTVGIGFLCVGVATLARGPRRQPRKPRWMSRVEQVGPIGAAGAGLFLANWEMETPALAEILRARQPLATDLAVLAAFTALAVCTSAAPLAVYLVAPARTATAYLGIKDWLLRHERLLLVVVCCTVGILFAAKGGLALSR
jgi:hypothetical protein